ncbi:4716_t:CDS:10 [Acaulospora morrowiae]|uniref:Alpha-galactosidase n=1 Tax=Acaulospora morrowiae TaxID=94023 RepID=A0A9N9AUU4_9GLOM|nr:4716_t:CDS:10 [Acaulospora morrowiae]
MEKYSSISTVILLFIITTSFIGVLSLENGLGRTPPMGWNSWNRFGCQIDEDLIKGTADALVSFGFADAGYKYLNLDDCWEGERNQEGFITYDKNTFPNGIKALADYVHSKGLLVGIYSDAGFLTCARRAGSLGYEEKDAQTFASWGIDYLKYDNCNNDGSPEKQRYTMRDALNATGRPIFYSICEWGTSRPYLWGSKVGNSWRTTGDIRAEWMSVTSILKRQQRITHYAGPGGWNDPDMLQVGNGHFSIDEQKSHFSLWAALKAPLLLGFDIRTPPEDTIKLVLNPEIIAINQDPLGKSVAIAQSSRFFDIWTGPLIDGHVALLFNRAEKPLTITLDFSYHCQLEGEIHVRDLWERADIGNFTKGPKTWDSSLETDGWHSSGNT